jgi:periplasmic divalent cation tolerance protein
MDIRFVYITAGNRDEATAIGRGLVSARIATCANIIYPVHSIYWWEGKVQEESEVIIVAKTREDLVDDLIKKVKSMHSYECPCIVTLPILEGYGPFLEWVLQETRKTGGQ